MRLFLVAGALALCSPAQTLTQPPPLVRVVRRPALDTSAIRRYAEGGAAVHVFGMTSITGLAETWLVEMHDSFAGLEQLDQALRGPATAPPRVNEGDQLLPPATSLIGLYRPGLSYRPSEAMQALPRSRYIQASVCRVEAGQEDQFRELVKARKVGLDSVNLDRPEIGFQVISGAPSGTYLFVTPLASLKLLDEGLVKAPGSGQNAARGMRQEGMLLRMEPGMSYVSDEFAQADPAFWRAKP